DNPEGFAFCGFCTAPLERQATSRSEERKVVSVLFVDLVGFTAASEAADPEDVRARLVPYQAMLKREIERFGGTVEKFIGDARLVIEYEELPPATLKGKSEPVAVWHALGARSRFGVDVDQRSPVPLIGRDREVTLLQQVFERSLNEPSVQLVTVSGEPGVGKS